MKRPIMRSYIFVFLLMLTLVLSTALAFAAGEDHILTIDGNVIDTGSVPPAIENDRALVPLRAVFEAIGATVEWSAENASRIGIAYEGQQVELTIDSTTAYVDGVEKTLDVPARLINNERVVVPVRFVTESFNFTVDYDPTARIIKLNSPQTVTQPGSDITNGNNTGNGDVIVSTASASVTGLTFETTDTIHRVTITTDEPIQYHESFILANPHRFVVDMSAFGLALDHETITADEEDNNVVKAVRAGQFSEETVRIVVDLKQYSNASIFLEDNDQTMRIEFRKRDTLPEEDAGAVELPETPPAPDVTTSRKPDSLSDVLIVIDAGHGGADPGSAGKENGVTVLNEKDINLDVATRVNQKLQAAGLNTYMGRTGDTFVGPNSTTATEDLIARAEKYNEIGATLVVSIHNNSANNVPTARGTETLYNDEIETKALYGFSSKSLAELIQKNMIASLGTYNRGAKSRPDLGLLRRTEMPAIIVEGAFLSNADDLAYMKTDEFREKYATAVAESVIQYLNDVFK